MIGFQGLTYMVCKTRIVMCTTIGAFVAFCILVMQQKVLESVMVIHRILVVRTTLLSKVIILVAIPKLITLGLILSPHRKTVLFATTQSLIVTTVLGIL